MTDREIALRLAIEQFITELKAILEDLGTEEAPKQEGQGDVIVERMDLARFFAAIRTSLFRDSAGRPRLTAAQVSGMEDILKGLRKHDVPRSWAAYVLATAYHETAQRMQPVREGLNASDSWRRRNLRYYPWYGRGHVQLTWEENYRRADRELGLNGTLVADADRALEPEISVAVMIRGMLNGWFSGDKSGRHTLARHLPNVDTATREQFRQARRIVNLMDKADLIAGQAILFQNALTEAGY